MEYGVKSRLYWYARIDVRCVCSILYTRVKVPDSITEDEEVRKECRFCCCTTPLLRYWALVCHNLWWILSRTSCCAAGSTLFYLAFLPLNSIIPYPHIWYVHSFVLFSIVAQLHPCHHDICTRTCFPLFVTQGIITTLEHYKRQEVVLRLVIRLTGKAKECLKRVRLLENGLLAGATLENYTESGSPQATNLLCCITRRS